MQQSHLLSIHHGGRSSPKHRLPHICLQSVRVIRDSFQFAGGLAKTGRGCRGGGGCRSGDLFASEDEFSEGEVFRLVVYLCVLFDEVDAALASKRLVAGNLRARLRRLALLP